MHGVAVDLDNEIEKTLLGYNPVNEQIISIRLNGKQRNITIVQVYAPMSQADEEEIEKLYAELQSSLGVINNRHLDYHGRL